jgi:DNA-binding transcriptional ArsR family regulator
MSATLGVQRTAADQQLITALKHPIRAQALITLNARTASPKEIADDIGAPVGTVSYHVNVLERLRCIELVRTAQRRGATEHFYRGVGPQYLDDKFWAKLSGGVRSSISLSAIRVLIGAVRQSVKAGLFDRRKDRHLSVVTYNLDDRGWGEATKVMEETLNRIMEIGVESEGRIAEAGGEKTVRATFGMLGFESP